MRQYVCVCDISHALEGCDNDTAQANWEAFTWLELSQSSEGMSMGQIWLRWALGWQRSLLSILQISLCAKAMAKTMAKAMAKASGQLAWSTML